MVTIVDGKHVVSIDSKRYDISALDRVFTIKTAGYQMRINPCRSITSGNSFITIREDGDDDDEIISIGSPLKHFPSKEENGGFVTLYGGDGGNDDTDYDGNGFPFIMMVSYVCDRDSFDNSSNAASGPSVVVNDNSKFFVIWRTPAACPIDDGHSMEYWGYSKVYIAIFILLFLFFCYICIGSYYNYCHSCSRIISTKIIPHSHYVKRLFCHAYTEL